MEHILVITFLALWAGFHFFFQPRVGATVAADHGEDYGKWHINIIIFGLFALAWLYLGLNDLNKNEKRAFAMLICCEVILLIAAGGIESFTSY